MNETNTKATDIRTERIEGLEISTDNYHSGYWVHTPQRLYYFQHNTPLSYIFNTIKGDEENVGAN